MAEPARDDLRDAFDAFREETKDKSHEPPATLKRVLQSSRTLTRRRLAAWKLGFPMAAVLVVGSAWAAASGKLAEPSRAGEASPRIIDAMATVSVAKSKGGVWAFALPPAPSAEESPVAPVVPSASNAAVAVASMSAEPSQKAPTLHALDGAKVPSKPTSAPIASDARAPERNLLAEDKAAFEAAYRIHASGTPEASVAAWDGYLAAHPNGRFVPEARYARAVALARAGQKSEARDALREFADGAPTGYRHDDAVKLMGKLQ